MSSNNLLPNDDDNNGQVEMPPPPPPHQLSRNISAPQSSSSSTLPTGTRHQKSASVSDGARYGSAGQEELFLQHRNSGDTSQMFEPRPSVKPMGGRPMGFDVVARVKRLQRKERSLRRLTSPTPEQNIRHQPFSFLRSSSTRQVSTEGSPLLTKQPDRDGSIREEEEIDEKKKLLDESLHDEVVTLLEKESTKDVLIHMFFGRPICLLLLFMPFAWLSHHLQWSPSTIFWCNFFAMVPLASILGDFTEEVAAHTNQVIGGLVNATFGNMVEVVVAIQALLANEIRVVQASMIGSIFSNLLLVLGCCFFFGGLKYKEQTFNSTAASANMGLLALSSIALVLPTPFAEYYDIQDEHVLAISRFAAIFLMFMYIQLLVFQLKTHAHVFEEDDDEEGEEPEIPMSIAMAGLLGCTLLVAVFSEYLVSSIDGFTQHSGVSRTFVGLIILPIVGNAVEHLTAVSVAMKDKMDLAMGISIGSCTQISLFVIPLTVLVGWVFDKNMTLNFPHFEIILYVLSIITVSICIANPKGNWLEGSLLTTTYVMIAVGFWYENVVDF